MKKARFTEQQIIAILKEAEAGMPISELCRKYGISTHPFAFGAKIRWYV